MYKNIIIIALFISGCKSDEIREVRADISFTQRFELGGEGLTGADGTYSVLLPDGRTVWIFGDSFLGAVTPELTRIKTDPMYIRNCFVLDDGKSLKTIHQGEPEEFKSMLIPPRVTESKFKITERQYWYWPGDGWVEDGKLKVFASEFYQNGDGMWDFEFKNTALFTYSLPNLKEISIDTISYSNALGIHYGHSVCKTDEYVYVYGLLNRSPHVARIDNKGSWQFYTGNNWSDSAADSKPMIEMDGSEQFSVFSHNGQYVMIMQAGSLSDEIYSYIASTPFGTWENKTLLYKTPKAYENDQLFTYNALAHPQFTENDELLISYNTNSFELGDHFVNAGIYRPRFIRVPFELILEK